MKSYTTPDGDAVDQDALRAAVVGALADLEKVKSTLTAALANLDGTESVDIGRQGQWTKGDVALLWDRARHLAGVRALFETTAARPGETVTFTEIVTASGLPERQQANEHARLSRLATTAFGAKRWPIDNWQGGTNTATGRAEMLYQMPPRVAEWWLDIEKQHNQAHSPATR